MASAKSEELPKKEKPEECPRLEGRCTPCVVTPVGLGEPTVSLQWKRHDWDGTSHGFYRQATQEEMEKYRGRY